MEKAAWKLPDPALSVEDRYRIEFQSHELSKHVSWDEFAATPREEVLAMMRQGQGPFVRWNGARVGLLTPPMASYHRRFHDMCLTRGKYAALCLHFQSIGFYAHSA
jgi:hypothetical protein